MKEKQSEQPEQFFNREKIVGMYAFRPMVERWRDTIVADPNYWWDISRHQMVRDLPEGERQGAVEENPAVHIDNQPWGLMPPSIQEVLRTVYDCASYDPDYAKSVSLTISDRQIRFDLSSPSLRKSVFSNDLYGESTVSDLYLQLVDNEHPAHTWYTEPSRVPAGFWQFAKWPMARDAREKEIARRRYEEGVEATIAERLMLSIPKSRIVISTPGELKDLGTFLERTQPQAKVWYVDPRFFPQIAQAPWLDELNQ